MSNKSRASLILSQSQEDYLKTMYLLGGCDGFVHVRDVAMKLNVKKPSVVAAVKNLVDRGLIKHERYGSLSLTGKGKLIAEEVCERHRVLFEFFHKVLGVESETAEKDACLVEHYISPETKKRLFKFIEFVHRFPSEEKDPRWLDHFRSYLATGRTDICAGTKEKAL